MSEPVAHILAAFGGFLAVVFGTAWLVERRRHSDTQYRVCDLQIDVFKAQADAMMARKLATKRRVLNHDDADLITYLMAGKMSAKVGAGVEAKRG